MVAELCDPCTTVDQVSSRGEWLTEECWHAMGLFTGASARNSSGAFFCSCLCKECNDVCYEISGAERYPHDCSKREPKPGCPSAEKEAMKRASLEMAKN